LTSPHLTVLPLLIRLSPSLTHYSLSFTSTRNVKPHFTLASHFRHPTPPNATANAVTCQRSHRTLKSHVNLNPSAPRNSHVAVSQLLLDIPPRKQLALTQHQLCTTPGHNFFTRQTPNTLLSAAMPLSAKQMEYLALAVSISDPHR